MCKKYSTSLKFSFRAVLVVAFLALVLQNHLGESQQACPGSLIQFQKCFEFVVPGVPPPSAECCNAIKGADVKCLCDTMKIATQLPSKCSITPITCGLSGDSTFLASVLRNHLGESQQACPGSLIQLQKCFEFVIPGAPPPSAECCDAIKGVDVKCLCDTMKIATQLPSKCSITPITCGLSG